MKFVFAEIEGPDECEAIVRQAFDRGGRPNLSDQLEVDVTEVIRGRDPEGRTHALDKFDGDEWVVAVEIQP